MHRRREQQLSTGAGAKGPDTGQTGAKMQWDAPDAAIFRCGYGSSESSLRSEETRQFCSSTPDRTSGGGGVGRTPNVRVDLVWQITHIYISGIPSCTGSPGPSRNYLVQSRRTSQPFSPAMLLSSFRAVAVLVTALLPAVHCQDASSALSVYPECAVGVMP